MNNKSQAIFNLFAETLDNLQVNDNEVSTPNTAVNAMLQDCKTDFQDTNKNITNANYVIQGRFNIDNLTSEATNYAVRSKNDSITSANKVPDDKFYNGHRERARERFINNESSSISDYDLLELMLFFTKPRVDVKPEAKKMIDHFKNFKNIANATEEELSTFVNNPSYIKYIFKLCNEIHSRVIYQNMHRKTVLNNWSALISYLQSVLCNKDQECFMAFYLNGKYELINQKIVAHGDVDRVSINPKQIIKDAINYNCKIIIIAHNHPSGATEPSNNDIEMTNIIASMAKSMDIILFDHVIVTTTGYFSFREHQLLEE